jgi:hypothetical protein
MFFCFSKHCTLYFQMYIWLHFPVVLICFVFGWTQGLVLTAWATLPAVWVIFEIWSCFLPTLALNPICASPSSKWDDRWVSPCSTIDWDGVLQPFLPDLVSNHDPQASASQGAKITDLSHSTRLILEIEPRFSHMLNKHSTISDTFPAPPHFIW